MEGSASVRGPRQTLRQRAKWLTHGRTLQRADDLHGTAQLHRRRRRLRRDDLCEPNHISQFSYFTLRP